MGKTCLKATLLSAGDTDCPEATFGICNFRFAICDCPALRGARILIGPPFMLIGGDRGPRFRQERHRCRTGLNKSSPSSVKERHLTKQTLPAAPCRSWRSLTVFGRLSTTKMALLKPEEAEA